MLELKVLLGNHAYGVYLLFNLGNVISTVAMRRR